MVAVRIHGDSQMMRGYREADIDQILAIWLSASIKAHDFIEPDFWKSKVGDMREVYIPASETFVYEAEGQVVGFYSLYENNLAAIFVEPGSQGRGLAPGSHAYSWRPQARWSLTPCLASQDQQRWRQYCSRIGSSTPRHDLRLHTQRSQMRGCIPLACRHPSISKSQAR